MRPHAPAGPGALRCALALAPVLALAAPATARADGFPPDATAPWPLSTITVSAAHVAGGQPGEAAVNGAPREVRVGYARQLYALSYDLEHYFVGNPVGHPDVTVFGTPVGVRFSAALGYTTRDTVDAAPGVRAVNPLTDAGPTLALGAGTLVQILRATGFVVAIHASLGFEGPARWYTGGAFAAYGGVRAVYQPGWFRAQARYDIMPFWAGADRIEHRASVTLALAPSGGRFAVGLRFFGALGQERRPSGGYTEATGGLGLEFGL